ncbi:MAG: bifunctional phosphoribosylaminoimidazolecarboxamide formyltransferase/IMP cyclohydrolase [Micavibrio aeruginosavorus]|uniref:Bifunctional purine biosynthesis protein PurH n=1 Tax=Micavibrio aeruginosavorus TaxID=349221 RepID=A0A7T5R1T6_9BACT|nr:MAG: bifunctional phosphoribosylaminoimidazolecarboxamide formyltransferase/IMP cyclohydrolase [Micavibrio aeruginosavorus]
MTAPSRKTAPALAPDLVPVKRALISVSDKTGLTDFAKALAAYGIEILSTGGTAKTLREAGIAIKDVSEWTGFPEIMDGRVKTLHPKVHGGILARRDEDTHVAAMKDHDIGGIDLVVVSLYPFEATVAAGADFAACIENIDIGGPAMIRASAKNHDFVTIVTGAADYNAVLENLNSHNGSTTLALRRKLAAKAFSLTSYYDSRISNWLRSSDDEPAVMPTHITFGGTLKQTLRYGENPHQSSALYVDGSNRPGVATAKQIQGKELSYNNLNDTDAAYELVAEFEEPTVAIIKHANPCGVASAKSMSGAYQLALRCDPVSAFGGIIALNRTLDAATASEITKIFSEVIIAPAIDDNALPILAKKANVRVLVTGALPDPAAKRLMPRPVAGGLLVQDCDFGRIGKADLTVVTKRTPTEKELSDLLFAFRVGKHVKSNAIVYARDGATVGIGAGQMSRVDSCRIAAWKAGEAAKAAGLPESLARGSVVASDAFFPFADGLLAAIEAGATAVIQPGGSIRDDEVIAAADAHNLAMVLTGMRHFRH